MTDSPIPVIFEHLWAAPDTSYAIEADLLAWSEDFNTFTIPLGDFETWKGVESESGVVYRNLWAEDVQCWSALYTEPTPVLQWHAEEEAQSLLSPVIDLSPFRRCRSARFQL